MLKRYLVFAHVDYYPGGGFEDFVESFASKKEAMKYVENHVGIGKSFDWECGQVVDQNTTEKWYYETFYDDEYSWE